MEESSKRIGLGGLALMALAAGLALGGWVSETLGVGLVAIAVLLGGWAIWPRVAEKPVSWLRRGTPPKSAIAPAPADQVTVTIESYTLPNAREFGLVVTNHGERRRFHAQVELLFGCERDVPGWPHKRFYLPWEGQEGGSRILSQGENGTLKVARWTIENGHDLAQLWFTMGIDWGGVGRVDTAQQGVADDRRIYLEVRIFGNPDLPNGPVVRQFSFDWEGLRQE